MPPPPHVDHWSSVHGMMWSEWEASAGPEREELLLSVRRRRAAVLFGVGLATFVGSIVIAWVHQ